MIDDGKHIAHASQWEPKCQRLKKTKCKKVIYVSKAPVWLQDGSCSAQTQKNFLLAFMKAGFEPHVLLQTEPAGASPIIQFCTQCARGFLGPFEQENPFCYRSDCRGEECC